MNGCGIRLVEEKDISTALFEQLELLLNNKDKQVQLASNCKKMDKPKAAEKIVDIIEDLING